MISLPITSVFTACFATSLVGLSLPVSLRRVKTGEMIGNGSDVALRRLIRTQGNFIEYVPLNLIALGLVEARGMPGWLVWSIGSALAGGRTLHAIGMLQPSAALRGFGMLLTYLALLVSAGALVWGMLLSA